MNGFFTKAEASASSCGTGCKLDRTCRTPRMKTGGKGRLGVMLIGEAPGKDEDAAGTQWVGRAGEFLKGEGLKSLGVNLDEDCWKANSVCCRPPDNRKPTAQEVEACRPKVLAEIARLRPKVVVLLGGSAIQSVVGNRWKKDLGDVARWRGWTIPDHELGCWVCPTWHPSFMLRQHGDEKDAAESGNDEEESVGGEVAKLIWRQDLSRAFGMLDAPLPKLVTPETAGIEIDPKRAIKMLILFAKSVVDFVAVDCETTGKKPDREGHEVWSVSASDGNLTCSALLSDVDAEWNALIELPVPKAAHNVKFEHRWYRKMGSVARNWVWDSMLSAHAHDNRPQINSLKFQSYVRFGVAGYDDEMEQWLRADESNDFNKVRDAPRRKLLIYGGMDALMCHKLSTAQMKEAK